MAAVWLRKEERWSFMAMLSPSRAEGQGSCLFVHLGVRALEWHGPHGPSTPPRTPKSLLSPQPWTCLPVPGAFQQPSNRQTQRLSFRLFLEPLLPSRFLVEVLSPWSEQGPRSQAAWAPALALLLPNRGVTLAVSGRPASPSVSGNRSTLFLSRGAVQVTESVCALGLVWGCRECGPPASPWPRPQAAPWLGPCLDI